MIPALLILLAQAAGPPTPPSVGDTIWIERALGTVQGAVVRPQPWSLGELGQQLGPAQVALTAEGTMVRYALVIWYAGDHLLKMPGPVVVHADGRSDTLAVSQVRVRVLSVLPATPSRSQLAPRPPTEAVPLASQSLLPVLVLVLLVVVGFGIAAILWRRRGKAPVRKEPPIPDPAAAILHQWAARGEYRAALHEWAWILARRMRLSQDLNETGLLQRVLEDISFTSYSPISTAKLAELCQRAAKLAGS